MIQILNKILEKNNVSAENRTNIIKGFNRINSHSQKLFIKFAQNYSEFIPQLIDFMNKKIDFMNNPTQEKSDNIIQEIKIMFKNLLQQ